MSLDIIKTIGPAEGMLILFILFITYILPSIISYYLAKRKKLPPIRWVILTLIFSWPIVVALLFFPKRMEM